MFTIHLSIKLSVIKELTQQASLLLISLWFPIVLFAQTAGDYRTNRAAVNWNDETHWDTYNGTTWVTASFYPGETSGAGTVTILDGHTATLNVSPANAIGTLVIGGGTSGTFTTSNNDRTLIISNDLIINANASFNLRRITLTVEDETVISGSLTDNHDNGSATFEGIFTVNNGGSFSTNNDSDFYFEGGITNEGTFSKTGTGDVTFSTNSQTIAGSGDITMDGRIRVTGITVTNENENLTFTRTNANSLTGTGTWQQGTDGVMNIATSSINVSGVDFSTYPNTVNYNRTGAQTIYATTYYHLTVSGNNTKTLGGAITVNGNLDISGTATLASDIYQITGNGTGTMTMASGTTLTLGNTGNATNILFPTNYTNGNISLNSGSTVTYQNNSTQTVSGTPTYGNLTIATGGTKTLSSSTTIGGNLTISAGTFDLGTTATSVSVSGTSTVTGTLTFNGTSTKTVSITGDLSGAGTINMSGGSLTHTLNLGGANNAITTFTTAAVASTVNYNANGNQQVFTSINYRNLTISGSGTKTLQGNTTVNNDLNISGGTFEVNSRNTTISGSTTISGIFSDNNTTGTNTFVGLVTVNNGGSLTTSLNSPFVFRGGIDNEGTFSKTGTGAVTFSNNPQTLSGSQEITLNGIVTVTGVTVTNEGTVSLTSTSANSLTGTGTWEQGNGGSLNFYGSSMNITGRTFSTNSNTVEFIASGVQTIPAETYHNIHVGGSGIKTLAGAITVNGLLRIKNTATLASDIYQITGNVSGTMVMGSGTTLTLGNTANAANVLFPTNLTSDNISLNSSSTVTYQNNSTQTVSSTPAYGNLTIATGGTKTLAGDVTIGGNLTISAGTFDLGTTATSITVSGTATVTGTLTFNGTTTKTVSITGDLSGAGTINMSGGSLLHTLNLGGATNAITTFTTAAVASTVNYNANGAQTVFASTNYRNLSISTGGIKTLQGATTANNDLTIGGSATLEVAANNFTVSGTSNISGTFSDNNNTGTNTFTGLLTVNNGGSVSTSQNSPFAFRGGIDNEGTINKTGTGTVTFSNNPQTISGSGSITMNGIITVTGITVTNESEDLTFTRTNANALTGTGTWEQGDGGVLNIATSSINVSGVDFSTNSNTVNYNRSGAQNIYNTAYHNLSVSTSNTKTLGGSITVNGNLSINNSTLAASTFDIDLKGNWSNVAGAFTPGTRTVTFSGSTQQTIAANAQSFYNVTFNNTASGIDAISLNSDMTITNLCTMTDGIIETNSYTLILTSTTAANLTGYSSACYVNGNLRRSITNNTSTYALPVGSAAYQLAEIKNNNMTTTTTLDAKFGPLVNHLDNEITACDGGLCYQSVSFAGMWTIDANANPGTGSYDIYLYTANMTGIIDNEFAILKRPTGSLSAASWIAESAGSINATNGLGRMAADGYALRMGITSFSEFGIGRGQDGGALPIQLIDFNASLNADKTVELKWITASEINNDYFTIERSSDGVDFEIVDEISGAGNSSSVIHYNYTDTAPLKGLSYYRLKQTDFDGTSVYSEIISVKIEETVKAVEWNVYPNPVIKGNYLNISSNHGADNYELELIEATSGKLIYKKIFSEEAGDIYLNDNLIPGIYFARIKHGADAAKLIKVLIK